VVEAQLEQVPVRRADLRAGRDPQDLHDLVSVEVRPDRGQLFLLGEPGDALLEVVVRPAQPLGLALVAGRAVGAREHVQPREQVAGVPDVAADRRVGPLALAVPVEAQVQLDELRDRRGLVAGEPQRLHPLAGDLRADRVVVVEGHRAVALEAAGARLADVVHEGSESRGEVRAVAGQPVLEVDGLLEHGEGVLVDVLVPVVLVALQRQRRELGQHVRGQPGLHEQGQPGTRTGGADELHQLVADPLGRDDRDPLSHVRHRPLHLGRHREAELGGEPGGPHHPQRVVGEGVLRPAGCTQHPVREVDDPAVRVLERLAGQHHRHRVDGEVTSAEVAVQGVAVVDGGLAAGRVVLLGAVGGDLDLVVAAPAADRAEVAPDVPDRVGPAAHQPLGDLRPRRRGEVEVVVQPAQHRVPHRSADQGDLLPGRHEPGAELVDHRRDPGELRHGAGLGLGHVERLVGRVFGHGR
jgi:hypothetical protein